MNYEVRDMDTNIPLYFFNIYCYSNDSNHEQISKRYPTPGKLINILTFSFMSLNEYE